MLIRHVHELYLVVLVNIVQLCVWSNPLGKRFADAERQILPAVDAHEDDVVVAGVAGIILNDSAEGELRRMAGLVKMQEHRVLLFVK